MPASSSPARKIMFLALAAAVEIGEYQQGGRRQFGIQMDGLKDQGKGGQKKKKKDAVVFFRPDRFHDLKKAEGEKSVDQGGAEPEIEIGGNQSAQQVEQVKKRDQQERNSGQVKGTVFAVLDRPVQGDFHRQVFQVGFISQVVLQVKIAVLDQALGDHQVMGLVSGQVDAPGVKDGRRQGKDQEGKEPDAPGFGIAFRENSHAAASALLGQDQDVDQHEKAGQADAKITDRGVMPQQERRKQHPQIGARPQ